jgi:iron complex outermembrane recepter protein
MNRSIGNSMLAAGSLLALGIAGPAISQDASPGTDSGNAGDRSSLVLEEIIVTARRVEERVQDVPISMTVYKQQRLDDLNVISAVDLALVTPSLAANASFGSENASLSIRGFSQVLDTAPSVGIYFADVVVPRGATQGSGTRDVLLPGSMFDLNNVQVLKGPQGTLFGRNTTGGAVLLVPQKPADEFEGYVEGSAGNYDMRRLQGMVNVALADSARLRVSADIQQRDGYLENINARGSSDFEDLDYQAVRASLVWDLTDTLENYTIVSYYESDSNGTLTKLIACNPTGYDPVNIVEGLPNFIGGLSCGQLAAEKERGTDFYDVNTPVQGKSQIEQWQVINTTTWELNEALTIKNIASYAQYQNTQKTALFGTYWQLEDLPAPYPSVFFRGVPEIFTAINPAPGKLSADQSTYTEELQFQGSLQDDRLIYQLGAYFEWSDPESEVGNQSPTLALCTDLAAVESCSDPLGSAFTPLAGMPTQVGQVGLGAAETTFRNRGVYAQSTYNFTDQWHLTAGLRYTWDEQKADIGHTTSFFPVTPPYTGEPEQVCTDPTTDPSCRQSLKIKSDKPTWLLGVDYFATEDILLYGKYSRGYRAGGIVNRAPYDYRSFEPEELDNYEVGIKTSFDGAISGIFNVAAFYNDLSNQQLQIGFDASVDEQGIPSGVAPTTGIGNAGKSRIYGAEVEASLVPLEGLILSLNYTWLNAELREIEDIETMDPLYQAQNTQIDSGSPLWQSPDNQLNLSVNYTLPLDISLGRVSLGVTYVYIDEQLTNYSYENPQVLAIYGENLGELPSIDLVNANINWEGVAGLPVDLSVFGTNLTDEHYYGYVPGLGSAGLETAVLGQSRMYGVRLRYRFGNE